MFDRGKSGDLFTFLFLPACLLAGWLIHFTWMIGLAGPWIPSLVLITLVIILGIVIRHGEWVWYDTRWLAAPILVILLALFLPWWNLTNVAFTDGAYHLIQSKNFLGRMDWSPITHELDFLMRPPIVPGFFSLELLFYGHDSYVQFTPLLLLVATLWQLQHLAERWAPKWQAVLVVPVFLLVPVVRYWGQMAYLDVPVAGMWILTLHLLLIADDNNENEFHPFILGLAAGGTFLTKYAHLYLVGIAFWLLLKDRNTKRFSKFLYGWFIIAGPYLLYHSITQGDPLAALFPQTSYAINSATNVLGDYTSAMWYEQFEKEITTIGVVGSLLGIILLWMRNQGDVVNMLVLITPLLYLHAVILDFGEARYHTPWLALAVVLMAVSLPERILDSEFNQKNEDFDKRRWMAAYSTVILLLVAYTNFQTLSDENQWADEYIPWSAELLNFHLEVIEDVPDDAILLSGHNFPIALNTGIAAYRFGPFNDPIADSIDMVEATHLATTNRAPRYHWEHDFDYAIGHNSIEPITVTIDEQWFGVLWEVNETSRLNPEQYFETTSGSISGDVLILGPGQIATIGSEDLEIVWIEVDASLSSQNVLRVITGDLEPMNAGCFSGNLEGEGCEFLAGSELSAGENSVIYAWSRLA